MSETIKIYTDGACSGNPGPGGWGALMIWKDHKKEIYGGEPDTTNNRMELLATIKALQIVKKDIPIDLYTDSTYVQKGVHEWLEGWKAKGWKTAGKKPVKNRDLWEQLDAILANTNVQFHWIKGHAGHPENERADELARRGIDSPDGL